MTSTDPAPPPPPLSDQENTPHNLDPVTKIQMHYTGLLRVLEQELAELRANLSSEQELSSHYARELGKTQGKLAKTQDQLAAREVALRDVVDISAKQHAEIGLLQDQIWRLRQGLKDARMSVDAALGTAAQDGGEGQHG